MDATVHKAWLAALLGLLCGACGYTYPELTGRETLEELRANYEKRPDGSRPIGADTDCEERNESACAWVDAYWKAAIADAETNCAKHPSLDIKHGRGSEDPPCEVAAGFALGCGMTRGTFGYDRDKLDDHGDADPGPHCFLSSAFPPGMVHPPAIDLDRAFGFLIFGCKHGALGDCSELAAIFREGMISGIPVPRDFKLARTFFDLANPPERAGAETLAEARKWREEDWKQFLGGRDQDSDEQIEERHRIVMEGYDKLSAMNARTVDFNATRSDRTMQAVAAGLSNGMQANAAVNSNLAAMHSNVNAMVAASAAARTAQSTRIRAQLSMNQPPASAAANPSTVTAPANAPGKSNDAAAKKAAEQQRKLDACLAKPVTLKQAAQSNPFKGHAQVYTQLLHSAGEGGCGKSDSMANWKSCMGSQAIGAYWRDEGKAQRDHDELFRRFNASATEYKGGSTDTCLDQPVAGTRAQCVDDDATVEVVRGNCVLRLRQDEAQMECDAKMLPLVWDAEQAKAKADAEEARDASCRVRFGDGG